LDCANNRYSLCLHAIGGEPSSAIPWTNANNRRLGAASRGDNCQAPTALDNSQKESQKEGEERFSGHSSLLAHNRLQNICTIFSSFFYSYWFRYLSTWIPP